MILKSPYVCLSRKLALFLTVNYHAKISVLNLRKYLTIKIDCNPGSRLSNISRQQLWYCGIYYHIPTEAGRDIFFPLFIRKEIKTTESEKKLKQENQKGN